jgi:hypothetical protein
MVGGLQTDGEDIIKTKLIIRLPKSCRSPVIPLSPGREIAHLVLAGSAYRAYGPGFDRCAQLPSNLAATHTRVIVVVATTHLTLCCCPTTSEG